MKRVLWLTLLFAAFAHAAAPTIGISPSANQGSGTALQTPTGFNSTAGGSKFLVLYVDSTYASPTVTDNFSNTYTEILNQFDSNIGYLVAFLCSSSCTGGTNHQVTVTAGNFLQFVQLFEIKGAGATDQLVGFQVTTGPPFSTAVTTTHANELILTVASQGQQAVADYPVANGGFTTSANGSTNVSIVTAYSATTTAGSYDPAWTRAGGSWGDMAALMISFESAGGASAPPPQPSPFAIGASLLPKGVDLASFAH